MTKDELKQEAEESFEKYRVTDIDYVVSPYSEDEGEKNLMFNNEYDAEEEYYRLYSKGYIASAEPREKRIADLEQENERLILGNKSLSEKLMNTTREKLDLQKENAELKSELSKVCGIKGCAKLTKAKELLTKWVELFKPKGDNMPPTPIQVETEQFLNSEVEK